jgi:hypothetical protein
MQLPLAAVQQSKSGSEEIPAGALNSKFYKSTFVLGISHVSAAGNHKNHARS